MAEVRFGRRREAANVDAHLAAAQRHERFDRARARVIERQMTQLQVSSLVCRRSTVKRAFSSAAMRARNLRDRVGTRIGHVDLRTRERREPACRPAGRRGAGMPTTVEFAGTSFTTTEPPPIFALSPIVMSPSTAALDADDDVVDRASDGALLCAEARAAERDALIDRQPSPTSAVSPITTPMP